VISISGLTSFTPGKNLLVTIAHKDGSKELFEVKHTYNEMQIEWYKAGGALNLISKKVK